MSFQRPGFAAFRGTQGHGTSKHVRVGICAHHFCIHTFCLPYYTLLLEGIGSMDRGASVIASNCKYTPYRYFELDETSGAQRVQVLKEAQLGPNHIHNSLYEDSWTLRGLDCRPRSDRPRYGLSGLGARVNSIARSTTACGFICWAPRASG